MGYKDKLAKILEKIPTSATADGLEKAGKLAQAPQKFAMNKIAESLGVRGNPENSEETSQNLVEAAAAKLGIPEDSTAGNIAKAAGVAGLEVFADPLSVIPAGKVAKIAEKARNSNAVGKILAKFPEASKLFAKAPEALKAEKEFADTALAADKATSALKVQPNIEEMRLKDIMKTLKTQPRNVAKERVLSGEKPIPYTHLVKSRR